MYKLLVIMLALLLIPISALAITPTEINQFTIADGQTPNTIVSFDDYIAVGYVNDLGFFASENIVRIYNVNNGALVYQQAFGDAFTCGSSQTTAFANQGMYYSDGVIYIPQNSICGGSSSYYFDFLDVSDIAFIDSKPRQTMGDGGLFSRALNDFTVLFEEFGDFTAIYNRNVVKINSTYGLELVPLETSQTWPLDTNLVDMENGFFVKAAGIYEFDYTDFQVVTQVGSISVGRGGGIDYNNQVSNPQFITNLGYFVLTGGSTYNDIKTSTVNITAFEPLFFFERGNIVGVDNDNNWISANATDLGDVEYIVSTEAVEGTFIKKHMGNNITITVLNVTDDLVTVYSVPNPSIDLGEESVTVAPVVEADFLGVDVSGDFIFQTTMSDVNGGRAYLSQDLYESTLDVTGTFYDGEVIDFSKPSDAGKVSSSNIAVNEEIIIEQLEGYNGTSYFEEYYLNMFFFGGFGTTIKVDFADDFYETQSDTVDFFTVITSDGLGTSNSAMLFSLKDDLENKLFELELVYEEFAFGTDTYTINRIDGGTILLATGDLRDEGAGRDAFIISGTADFLNEQINITIQGINETFYNGSFPFADSSARGIDYAQYVIEGSLFAPILSGDDFYVDMVGYSYESTVTESLDYEIFEDLEAGVALVKATRQDGPFEFGDYTLYSYATDEDFGFSYIDSSDVESFVYDENTVSLTEDEIEALILNEQAVTGALTDTFIEGDLFTDSLASAAEDYGFKSTASKLFLAFVLVLAGVAVGYKYGVIGSILGALGGLMVAFFVGWVPVWIVVSLVLVIVGIMAFEARKIVTGGR